MVFKEHLNFMEIADSQFELKFMLGNGEETMKRRFFFPVMTEKILLLYNANTFVELRLQL